MKLAASTPVQFTRDSAYGGGVAVGQTDSAGNLSRGSALFVYSEVGDLYRWQEPGNPPGDWHVLVVSAVGRYRQWRCPRATIDDPGTWILEEKGSWAV